MTTEKKNAKFDFRKSNEPDLPQLIRMSKNLYSDSRYYFDPNFPNKLCDQFYSGWVKKIACGDKENDAVYVLTEKEKILGYIAAGIEYGVVHLFLVGVDKNYRKMGMGKELLNRFIEKYQKDGYNHFQVVTQGRNIASQRLYQSYGFKITSFEIDYHKWF